MRKVHKVKRLVDHRQTDSGNGDYAADDQTIDNQLHPVIMMGLDVYNGWRAGDCGLLVSAISKLDYARKK
jgi:hypothetical protein